MSNFHLCRMVGGSADWYIRIWKQNTPPLCLEGRRLQKYLLPQKIAFGVWKNAVISRRESRRWRKSPKLHRNHPVCWNDEHWLWPNQGHTEWCHRLHAIGPSLGRDHEALSLHENGAYRSLFLLSPWSPLQPGSGVGGVAWLLSKRQTYDGMEVQVESVVINVYSCLRWVFQIVCFWRILFVLSECRMYLYYGGQQNN